MQEALQFGPSLDRQIDDIRNGKGPWRLHWSGMALLRALAPHRGAKNPIALAELAHESRLTPREVKAMVRSLVVDFGLPVGASRAEPAGYYLAVSADERLAAARPYIHEIRNLAVRVRALVGTSSHPLYALLEQLGQAQFGDIR